MFDKRRANTILLIYDVVVESFLFETFIPVVSCYANFICAPVYKKATTYTNSENGTCQHFHFKRKEKVLPSFFFFFVFKRIAKVAYIIIYHRLNRALPFSPSIAALAGRSNTTA